MLHEVLLALLGHTGGVIKDTGNGLKIQSDLPFLSSSDEEQLNYLCRLGTHFSTLNTFIKKYGTGPCLPPQGVKQEGLAGLYLKAFCSGLDKVLGSYRANILELETNLMKDPHLSVSHLVCQLQQYQLLLPALVSVVEQVTSHKAHGCYILDIIHRHSETGHPLVKDVLTRVLHVCHGVLFKHLCSWLLYGYVYDPYKEFFIQPNEGESHDQSHDQTSQSQDDDDDLGIMGVTGRQLQKLLKMNTPDSSSSTSHLFSIKSDLLPGYIPVRVASKILFVGESIQMFQEKGKSAVSRGKSNILEGKQEKFAKDLHQLAQELPFNSMKFESLINDIRTQVAEVLWKILIEEADLLAHLRIIKDFYLLGRGELYLAFIDQAQHLLRVPVSATTEHDVNAAYLCAARNVLFHDEALLQRFRLSVKQAPKPQKKDSTSSSGSSQSSTVVDIGWNSLSLKYSVQWPLHIFFTPVVLEKYNRVFRFLLVVRRTQLDLHQCWIIQMSRKHGTNEPAEALKWQLRNHMSFLVDNLQYYLQVDVIESQYGILVEKIKTTRDYEAVKLAHDHFLSALLAQSFVHMKSVAHCLYEILDQCTVFTSLVVRCETPMSHNDALQLENIAKNLQRQSSLLFKMLSSVRSNSSSPHLAQLLLRLDFNKFFSISGGQLGSY
ncbi:gamma-tubulin complex component 4-like [Ruditapes philippinarum]|uniref:gamma-tubulin complex component 4-like n=1 Tax=Ruditapes philippinarum TaxID=129788 RepID=UPI00295A99BF|nr:gamma-tubulin complex component 4-like [Ruditapes philippinarum]